MPATTPFFPLWRARLAPMGRRVQRLRRQSLMHLDLLFGSWLPPWLLAQSDEGTNTAQIPEPSALVLVAAFLVPWSSRRLRWLETNAAAP